MAEQLKSALGIKPSTAARFGQRDQSIKKAQSVVNQGNRELSRERASLDRKETKLLAEVRRLLLRGDTHSAHLVARQIATSRRIGARNLEASMAMDVKLQAMASNNKVNQRQWATMKAIQRVSGPDSIEAVTERAAKATRAVEVANAVEAIMNETMDDVYDFTGDEVELVGVQKPLGGVDREVEAILAQALDACMPRHQNSPARSQGSGQSRTTSRSASPTRYPAQVVYVKLASNPEVGASVPVDSWDVSIDMVKRALTQDPFAVHQLGLARSAQQQTGKPAKTSTAGACWPFSLGLVDQDSGEFHALPIDASLKNAGIAAGSVLFVHVHNH